jgi:ribokinase
VETAYRENVPVFFDPGPEYPRFSDDWLLKVLKRTTGLILTREEALGVLKLDDNSSTEMIVSKFHELGPRLVVIKLGGGGCFLHDGNKDFFHKGFPVTVVDTSGAGDVVAGILIFTFLNHFDLYDTCVLMNAAGAVTVGKLGAGRNIATKDEIIDLLQSHNFGKLVEKIEKALT